MCNQSLPCIDMVSLPLQNDDSAESQWECRKASGMLLRSFPCCGPAIPPHRSVCKLPFKDTSFFWHDTADPINPTQSDVLCQKGESFNGSLHTDSKGKTVVCYILFFLTDLHFADRISALGTSLYYN